MAENKTDKIDSEILALRDDPPRTKEDLDNYLRYFYKVYLINTPIDEGNSSALDFVWDIYSTAMGWNENSTYNFLACSSRGSGKSLSCAVLEVLLMHHEKVRNLFHMAAIKEQAYVTYDYFCKIVRYPIMAGVFSEPTRGSTSSRWDTKIKIGTATKESVNSFHGSTVMDEIDLTPKAIFDEAKGMLSAERGRHPLNICISSRKFGFGNVQMLLDYANDPLFPIKVHKWGILECTEQCLPSRHGPAGETIYVDENELLAISKEQFDDISVSKEKEKYVAVPGYKNCLDCGIFSFCKGQLTKPKNGLPNPYLEPIEVTRNKFKTEDVEFFKAQRLNRKPSSKGLVYPMWDESIHVKSYAQMWEIFHGEPHPDTIPDQNGKIKRSDITLKELTDAFDKAGCQCYMAEDFGFSVLAVAGLFYVDGSDRIYFVDELFFTGLSDAELAREVKNAWGHYPVQMAYCDPESPSGKKELRKATGWAVTDEVDKDVDSGISTMRRFMRIPGTKKSMFFASPRCRIFCSEVKKYHYKIDPITNEPTDRVNKKDDHCFTDGHEILTDSGWKYFSTLNSSDRVACINTNKEIFFEHPLEIIEKQYDGDVLHFKNANLDFTVTPNHRVVNIHQWNLKKSKDNKLAIDQAKDLLDYREIYIPIAATGGIVREPTYVQPFKEWGLSDYEWGWLLGFFLAEGCTNINYNHYRTIWDQKKPQHVIKMNKIVNKIKLHTPIQISTNKNGVVRWTLQQRKFYDYFAQFGKCDKKHIPRDILSTASIETLDGVFWGMMDGDGSFVGNNSDYGTTSLQLANDFSELCTLLGYPSNVKGPYAHAFNRNNKCKLSYKVRIRSKYKNYPCVHFKIKSDIKYNQYSGKIYCVTVSSGMIVCRHNNRVFISGNSMDMSRYFVHSRYGGTQWNLDCGVDKPKSQLEDFNPIAPNRAPTAVEWAKKLGVPFNDNSADFDEYGKPKKKPDGDGGSGFSFSF